jgi:hypothetical protein
VTFVTTTTFPCLVGESTAQQKKRAGERNDCQNPHNWVSGVEHGLNRERHFSNSRRFKPDGKCGAAHGLVIGMVTGALEMTGSKVASFLDRKL